MPDFEALELKVSELIKEESPTSEFRSAFNDIEEAAKTTTDAEVPRLSTILSSFRAKLPGLIVLKPIRGRARDLADTLMLSSLQQRIGRINARNEALSSLTSKLNTQIAQTNGDAGLLGQIKEGVERATKTVTELKSLVNQLTATDATTKTQLLALIDSIGNISSIFAPEG